MIETPLTDDVTLITFKIFVEGKPISDLYQVHSIETTQEINRVPYARITIYDGSPAEANFEISDLATFMPGKSVDIKVGYESMDVSLFKGVIVKHGIKMSASGTSFLLLDVYDPALKMTITRKSEFFPNVTDSDVIGKLITGNGLARDVERTTTKYEELTQYYATDWDMMIMRAELNGFIVTLSDGKVTVKKPDTSQAPVLELSYGDTIIDFQADLDATNQIAPNAINGYAWDPSTLSLQSSAPGPTGVKEQGSVSSATLAKVFDIKKYPLQTSGSIPKDGLKSWASAELIRSQLSKIKGRVTFQGNASVIPGKTIRLSNLNAKFNGDAFVTAVYQSIQDGNWTTEVYFGMNFQWFSETVRNIAVPTSAGQLPPIKGLQSGIVKKINSDPDGNFRILVNLPLFQNANKSVWSRLGNFYANNKTGALFMPEIGDEVIVGFFNEDPRYAVVLGSLYSKKMPPPFVPDEKNSKKGIVSRENLQLVFDETDKSITVKTPGGHTIILNDKTGDIKIVDSNKNSIQLAKGGVNIDSATNLNLTAKGDITLNAKKNVNIKATANLSCDGAQISHSAKTKFSAKGNAAAELAAAGIVTVKGAMVKIN